LFELSFFQKKDKVLLNAKSNQEKQEWIDEIRSAIKSLVDTHAVDLELEEGLF
jgi:hypothetical protein